MLSSVPLIAILVIIYNVIVFVTGPSLDTAIFSLTMISGEVFTLTLSQLLITLGLVLLFIEMVKSTATGAASIINHGLSMLTFIICLIEFIVVKEASNGTFFLIGLLALFDVIAGFAVTITTARRDFSVSE